MTGDTLKKGEKNYMANEIRRVRNLSGRLQGTYIDHKIINDTCNNLINELEGDIT